MEVKELEALITLLDDPDHEIYNHVYSKLSSIGAEIIPALENVWEKTFDPLLHKRIEDLIHGIQFEQLCKELNHWSKYNSDNLLNGALLISKYQYPDFSRLAVMDKIEKLKREIWLEMNYNLTPLEQVNVFNHVLYGLNGFGANTLNIQDPQNCYFNKLIETKKGNPISLGILYLILAEQMRMPVYGVDLPQHFILSYHKNFISDADSENQIKSSVLFYINPFNKGIIFTREDINLFLKKLNLDPKPKHFIPCNNVEIIKVLINSLIHCYELSGSIDKVNELIKLKEFLLSED